MIDQINLDDYLCKLQIPGFAGYKLFGLVKGFLPQGSEVFNFLFHLLILSTCAAVGVVLTPIGLVQGDEEDEKTRKKREKMEKRASRTKFVKTRTR